MYSVSMQQDWQTLPLPVLGKERAAKRLRVPLLGHPSKERALTSLDGTHSKKTLSNMIGGQEQCGTADDNRVICWTMCNT